MADTDKTPGGEHIEELLSQLKGIFGHLSETEQEEARQKVSPPPAASRGIEPAPPPTPDEVSPAQKPPEPSGHGPEAAAETSLPELVPVTPPEPLPDNVEPRLAEGVSSAPPAQDAFTPNSVTVPEGATLVPAAIFYPAGKVNEAKAVIEKVERITPKFTKVAVVLNVQALASYDLKADLKNTILSQLNSQPIKAVFFLVDKPIDENRRRSLVSDLDPRGVYFQEIPLHQIEKKALYTDMLLGMVFFFDSQKPAPGETAA